MTVMIMMFKEMFKEEMTLLQKEIDNTISGRIWQKIDDIFSTIAVKRYVKNILRAFTILFIVFRMAYIGFCEIGDGKDINDIDGSDKVVGDNIIDKNDSSISLKNKIDNSEKESSATDEKSGESLEDKEVGNEEMEKDLVKEKDDDNPVIERKNEAKAIVNTGVVKKVEKEVREVKDRESEKTEKQGRAIAESGMKGSNKTVQYSDGLLDIIEGDYKYERIPEFRSRKEVQNKEIVITSEIESPKTIESQEIDENEDGFLGFNKRAADIIVKVVLIFIIIGSIILFRMRSRDRSDSVLRRFPGA